MAVRRVHLGDVGRCVSDVGEVMNNSAGGGVDGDTLQHADNNLHGYPRGGTAQRIQTASRDERGVGGTWPLRNEGKNKSGMAGLEACEATIVRDSSAGSTPARQQPVRAGLDAEHQAANGAPSAPSRSQGTPSGRHDKP